MLGSCWLALNLSIFFTGKSKRFLLLSFLLVWPVNLTTSIYFVVYQSPWWGFLDRHSSSYLLTDGPQSGGRGTREVSFLILLRTPWPETLIVEGCILEERQKNQEVHQGLRLLQQQTWVVQSTLKQSDQRFNTPAAIALYISFGFSGA